ncbi:dihydrolipoyl dehydrogenase [Plakobranchus ocellatus]|uniref:dihydrolipoyl dehydrogenase n=1 Tax=Plakobranchus ocellatus TaxID=259542 RepID=A0AAV4CFW7_9GAST|nr:dihydrolipoyl dehydrogenase [Plakobranchus ocellatus]
MGHIAGGLDKDIARVIEKKLKKSFKEILVDTKVKSLAIKKGKVEVVYANKDQEETRVFDKVLLSIGRRPQSELLKIANINLTTDEKGFIVINEKMQTNLEHIFAIGDVAGNPMLAHKASREGHVAVEVILGKKTIFDNLGIPNVIYTDPEVAWVGLTENEAKAKGIAYKVGSFSWGASGRATAMNKKEGLTKILFHPKNERVLGVSIVGANAGELIGEGVLALEMGAVREDITATIHAHPTLSETFLEAAENLHGMATHMFVPKRKS